jgi:hypothetical protein
MKDDRARFVIVGRVERYPRWQSAITERAATFAVRHGLDVERSRRLEYWAARALGQPLSARSWNSMSFNDKVLYRKLVVRDERFRVLCDKVAFREFVTERVGASYLPTLRLATQHVEELAPLEGPFIVKGSHGSGMVVLNEQPRRLTGAELRTAEEWLGEDYGYWSREWGYWGLPRWILVEELMSIPPPPDYKIFVFDSVARAIQVDEARFIGHVRSVMSPRWELLGACVHPLPERTPPRPANLDEMLALAGRLAGEFDFMRVDLYDLGERVMVGEMTPLPIAGRGRYRPRSLDRELGRHWTTVPPRGGAYRGVT